jgi:hypothetical protein
MSFKTSKYASSFSPQDVPGLVVWLDAADSRTLTMAGSNVSRWNDKVTNGTQYAASNIFTGPTLGTVNGVQALRYTSSLGTGMMYFGSSYTPKTTGFTYFFAFSPTSSTTGGARLFHAYTATDRLFMILSNSVGVITGAATATSPTTPVFDNLTIVTAFEDTSAISVILNGSLATSAPTPAATAASTITQASIGTGFTGLDRMDGFMCEILLFNRNLPLAERQLVEGYLGRKWGMTQRTDGGFLPTIVPGLRLWLDALDANTLTLSGSNVTSWRDKSGYEYNASGYNNTATYNASGLNAGYPGIEFSSAKSMRSIVPVGTFSSAVDGFVVYKFTGSVNPSAAYALITRTQSSSNGAPAPFDANSFSNTTYRLIGNGTSFTQNTSGLNYITNSNPTIYNFGIQSTSNTTWTDRINGVVGIYTTGGGTGAAYGDTASNVVIGGRMDTAVFYQGVISEVILYNTALTVSQRRQVENYLSSKWNIPLSNSLLPAHPYWRIPPVTRPFNPLDVSGCSLWFDADDNRTLTLSGSNVTQWNDKSGNGHTATASGAARPTYSSSSRYLLFNGISNALTLSTGALPSGNSAYSIFIVAYTVNAANPQWILSAGVEATNQLLGVFFFTTNAVWHSWYINEYAVNNSITNGVPSIINVNYSTTRTTITNGGTPTTNNPNATRNNSTSGHFIGRLPTAEVQFLNGGIGEIVIFSREISTGERQQVELYLAEKWNLRPSLSSVNPLRLYRALSPVFNPTLISNCMVWLDAADSSRFTLTGSNVTTWLDKSGFGCNAIGSSNTGIYSSNGLDGKLPTVQFTPSNNMKVPAPSGTFPTGIAVFMVYQKTGANNTFDMGIARSQGGTPAPFDSYTVNIQQTHRIIGGTGGFPSNVETTTNLWRRTTPTALFMGIFSNTPTIWNESINGVFATYPTSPTTYADNADGIYIGARSDFTTVMRGNISEIIAYRVPSITTQQRQVVEAYLAKKWNIALPTTHPYYSTPV